jgi:hypothetical protein
MVADARVVIVVLIMVRFTISNPYQLVVRIEFMRTTEEKKAKLQNECTYRYDLVPMPTSRTISVRTVRVLFAV